MSAWYWADGKPPPPPEPHPSILAEMTDPGNADKRPHSRACGLYCRGHGAACSRDCPTCGGVVEPTASDLWEAPRIAPERQSGPGYVMTTHGPVRRATPPWDVPAQEWQG